MSSQNGQNKVVSWEQILSSSTCTQFSLETTTLPVGSIMLLVNSQCVINGAKANVTTRHKNYMHIQMLEKVLYFSGTSIVLAVRIEIVVLKRGKKSGCWCK